jgi:hypothetical protein
MNYDPVAHRWLVPCTPVPHAQAWEEAHEINERIDAIAMIRQNLEAGHLLDVTTGEAA